MLYISQSAVLLFEMWGHYSRIMHCIHSWIMASHFIPEILHLLCLQYPSCCNNHPHPVLSIHSSYSTLSIILDSVFLSHLPSPPPSLHSLLPLPLLTSPSPIPFPRPLPTHPFTPSLPPSLHPLAPMHILSPLLLLLFNRYVPTFI